MGIRLLVKTPTKTLNLNLRGTIAAVLSLAGNFYYTRLILHLPLLLPFQYFKLYLTKNNLTNFFANMLKIFSSLIYHQFLF